MNRFDKYSKSNLLGKGDLGISRIVLLVIGGIIVGFVSGLFGGGGGIIVVPLLVMVGRLKEKEAHATSIAIILPVAIVSTITYVLSGISVERQQGIMVTLGVVMGGVVGTFLLAKLSTNTLKLLFYIIMIVAGVKMLL